MTRQHGDEDKIGYSCGCSILVYVRFGRGRGGPSNWGAWWYSPRSMASGENPLLSSRVELHQE